MTATKTVKGLLGKKLGMTQLWNEDNRLVPVTVIEVGQNVVTQIRSEETDGYAAVQIGFGAIDPRKVTKPLTGHFEKAGVTPAATSSSCALLTRPTTRPARSSPRTPSRRARPSTSRAPPRARVSPVS